MVVREYVSTASCLKQQANLSFEAPVAQLVEQRTFNAKVEGSSPSRRIFYRGVAQLEERRILVPKVLGSNPSAPVTHI